MEDNQYQTGAVITGGIAFVIAWVYAMLAYGFFLGLGLGWIPAMVIAQLAAILWPVVALMAGFVILSIMLVML